jgi:hypothetical protein
MALKFLAIALISKKGKEKDENLLLDLTNLLPDQESVVTIKEVRDTQIIARCFNLNRDLLSVKEIVSKVSETTLNIFSFLGTSWTTSWATSWSIIC